MTTFRLPDLESVLGTPLEDAEPAHLRRLVEAGVQESDRLDFKRELHPRTPEGRAELAKDVCALANHRGGALVIGVAEVDGSASALIAQPVGDSDLRHVRSVVASHAAPVPAYEVLRVPEGTDGTGYLLIIVPPSPLAPHAVSAPNRHDLVYPVRDGTQTRYMPESEVAYAYRLRRDRAERDAQRGAEIRRRAFERLEPSPWISLALVPDLPGSMPLDYAEQRRVQEWVRERLVPGLDGSVKFAAHHTSARVGSLVFSSHPDEPSADNVLEFYADGSGFAAVQLPQPPREGNPLESWILDEEDAVSFAAAALQILALHAVHNAGTWGAATAELQVTGDPSGQRGLWPHPIDLTHARFHGMRRTAGTRMIHADAGAAVTVTLSDASSDGPPLIAATRLVVTPLLQAFGIPEPLQATRDGKLRASYFNAYRSQYVQRWASAHGVEWIGERP